MYWRGISEESPVGVSMLLGGSPAHNPSDEPAVGPSKLGITGPSLLAATPMSNSVRKKYSDLVFCILGLKGSLKDHRP